MLAVEKERLAREATDHHDSAMAETQRLVEEAEQRATPPRSGPARPRRRPPRPAPAAQTEAESTAQPGPARGRADRRLGQHPGRVDHLQRRRRGRAPVAALRAEVDRLAKRRDAITAQLASLRDVVAGFGDDED